jgi:hypothetical protein
LASFISEYFRESRTPWAPALKAARTAALVPWGVDLEWLAPVGMSMSMPGQMRVLVPAAPEGDVEAADGAAAAAAVADELLEGQEAGSCPGRFQAFVHEGDRAHLDSYHRGRTGGLGKCC